MKYLPIICLSMLLFFSCDSSTDYQNNSGDEQTEKAAPYTIGSVVEDFSLKNIDGSMVAMANYPEAKGFVIIFTCNHCPYSVAYEDRIIAMDKVYKEKGYPVIAINPNDPEVNEADSYEQMIVRAKEKEFTFPYLFDEGQKVYPAFGATKTPHCYLLNKEGDEFKVAYIGAFDDSKDEEEVGKKYLENAILAVMDNQKPNPDKVAAFGCSIKTKKQ